MLLQPDRSIQHESGCFSRQVIKSPVLSYLQMTHCIYASAYKVARILGGVHTSPRTNGPVSFPESS